MRVVIVFILILATIVFAIFAGREIAGLLNQRADSNLQAAYANERIESMRLQHNQAAETARLAYLSADAEGRRDFYAYLAAIGSMDAEQAARAWYAEQQRAQPTWWQRYWWLLIILAAIALALWWYSPRQRY